LGREPTRFDLVFADPPYASDELPRVLPALLAAKVLAADARVVVERDRRVPLAPVAGLTLEDERIYGETAIMRFSASG
jgi:16S rRNA G966 N2-methylase RsmD